MRFPRALRRIWKRTRGVFAGQKEEQDLAEEMAAHLQLLIEENLRLGMAPQEARREAQLTFGGMEVSKERYRDQRGWPWLETVVQDVRYAMRGMRQSPGFTAVAVAMLALGIGANTAIFSVMEAVVLRPLPYPEPDRLVSVFEVVTGRGPDQMNSSGGNLTTAVEPGRSTVSVADLMDVRRENRSFLGLAGLERYAANLTGQGAPERIWGERVTANYFSVIGVPPAAGRGFTEVDDRPAAAPVVILTHNFWTERFGGKRDILGRNIMLDERPYRVIGIMPAGYQPPSQFGDSEKKLCFLIPAAYPVELLTAHGNHDVMVIARLKPGVGVEQARADLAAISRRLAEAYPKTNLKIGAAVRPLRQDISQGARTPLGVLMAAVGMVLLIACVNLANLLLVRALGRRREITLRYALGASRARVIAGLVTGSALVAALGGAGGFVLGVWARQALMAAAPAIPRLASAGLDGPVVWFAAALSAGTCTLFGLLPAWQISRVDLAASLRAGERGMTAPSVMRWRNALTVVQVALSMVLLVGAGLLIRSLLALNAVSLGFQTEHILAARLDLPQTKYGAAGRRLQFFEALSERVRSLPGVEAVAFANRMPMRGSWSGSFFLETAQGVQGHGEEPSPGDQAVSPDYFRTLDIPVIRGRSFTEHDRDGTPPVAMVNQQFVKTYVRDGDAIGRRMRIYDTDPWMTIVGVVGDIHREGKAAPSSPEIYLPAAQTRLYRVSLGDFALRAKGDPKELVTALQRQVWALDKDQPLTRVQTMDEILWSATAERRFQTMLLTIFAALALLLTLIGIYGVIAYAVAQRTAEIGVRMALGARQMDVFRLVYSRALGLVVLGIAVGVLGSAALSRPLASLLFATRPEDPATYGLIALLLLVTAGLACYAPARRAMRLDPSRALRYE